MPERSDAQLRLQPGGMNTTLHEAALGLGMSPLVSNCQTEEGVWKVDLRQRRFSSPHAEFASLMSQGLGLYSDKDWTYLLGVNNAKAHVVDPQAALSYKGDQSRWSGLDVQGEETFESGDYVVWQHGKHAFMAGGESGFVFYFDFGKAADENFKPCRPLYRDYFLDTSGDLNLSLPPYTDYDYLSVSGGDTVTPRRGTASIESDGGFYWRRNGFVNGDTNETYTIAYATDRDWSRVDYLYFEGKNLDHDFFRKADGRVYYEDSDYYFRITDDGGTTWYECRLIPIIILSDPNTVAFWVDLTTVARSVRAAVDGYELRVAINISADIEIKYSPLRKGGAWLGKKSGDGFINDVQPGSVTGEIEYAYAFYDVSEADFSSAVKLPGIQRSSTLGEKIHPASHFMASEATFTIEPTTDAPFTTSDKVVLYRRKTTGEWVEVTDPVHALTGQPARATNDRDATTDEPPKIVDRLTQEEVDALTDAGALTFGNESDPEPSGKVTGIVCGASWKGANCLGAQDGFVYMSDATDFRRSLWYGVNIGKLTGDNAEPRTVEVDAGRIMGLVGQDALYCFTRTAGYAFVGDVPNKADLVRLPTVRGVVSLRAAIAFRGGCVFASDDGLYYVEIPPRVAGVSQEIKPQELTAENRRAWRDLMGDDPSSVAVAHHAGHLWAFNGSDYLHIWPSGKLCYGQWADGTVVKAVVAHPYYGLLLFSASGSCHVVGEFPTDGGDELDGSDGETVLWEYTSSRLYADADVTRIVLRTNEIGTKAKDFAESDVEVDVWSHKQYRFHLDDGSPPDVKTIAFRDVREMMRGVPKPCGGKWVQLTVRGNGYDEVYLVELWVAQGSPNTAG